MSTLFKIACVLSIVSLIAVPHTIARSVNGSRVLHETILAYDTDRFEPIRFYGGERAEVIVEGDGDTDLDLFVYDENWRLVASDDDSTDYCIARWTPRRTGSFHVVVENLGSVYNEYTLRTN
jgi:hypothetical protein